MKQNECRLAKRKHNEGLLIKTDQVKKNENGNGKKES